MSSKEFEHWLGKKMSFGKGDRISLYSRLARFSRAGIPVVDSINSILKRHIRRKDLRAEVFKRISQAILAGRTLEEAFRPYLPSAELQLIAAGDVFGNLEQGFQQAKFVAQAISRMKSALIGQMVYPAVLLLLLTMILYILATNLMPVLEGMLDVNKWPGFAQVLKHLADWLVNYGLMFVTSLTMIFGLAVWSLPRWVGNHELTAWSMKIRNALDKFMPPYNMFREYQAATFLIGLGSLMSTGNPVDQAIAKLSSSATAWTKTHLDKMRRLIKGGANVSTSMRTGLIDRDTVDEIEDYESANALEETLTGIGEETIESSIARLQKMGMIIRLVMLVMVMGMIIWIYASLVFVIMKVASEAKRG